MTTDNKKEALSCQERTCWSAGAELDPVSSASAGTLAPGFIGPLSLPIGFVRFAGRFGKEQLAQICLKHRILFGWPFGHISLIAPGI